VKKIVIVKDFV